MEDILTGKIFAFIMIVTRLSAFFGVVPIFSMQTTPIRIRAGIIITLAAFFSLLMPTPQSVGDINSLAAIILIAGEIIYGFALGLVIYCIITIVRISARIAERQMGLMMASIIDPLSGADSQPLSMIIEMIFFLLLLSMNAHHLFIKTIFKSFEAFPIGTMPSLVILVEGIIKSGAVMLIMGLKLAAPVLATFIFILVVLAIFAKIAPEMNILMISLPVRVGLGILMAGIFLPFLRLFANDVAMLMDKLLPI